MTPEKHERTVPVPQARRMKEGGRVRMVPFNPERASELLLMQSFSSVSESVVFWLRRLDKTQCPECGKSGTLQVEYVAGSLAIECKRSRLGKCDFTWEPE